MGEFRLGDALFQLIMLGSTVLAVVFIIYLFRTFFKQKKQIDNLERRK
ncbi:DUF4083 domain-containing protein [Virgibacillus pantothenticus]|nr:DUF4083 domain-containing protein [Virgibacillus pantothenticus]MBU8565766.1 DUF4083 domain-containing protein [Virgibacillus pantothenticus]MBU8599647.1 DUF4083 domain-containing protein [Virgibacillus pantothenticus]MBU8634094.1 DUF4083 domain-containing protein [Virgibacillus pantothenticus]MBU8642135.1 DUF4083 domain-containing protein [Virgibacillus pantothenticus]MBU8645882.1 DUF4083 domain-containing protein [Virgibacillus pantothenticus]